MMQADGIVLRRAYTDCRVGQMHYREARPRLDEALSAPTLVMLHQNPSSSFEYEALMQAMATDRRVIAFDTPGYGMSDPPPRPLSMAAYAACFGDAMDVLGLGETSPVDAFGYHTGALLAAELGLQRPRSIGRLALCGVPWRTEAECAVLLAKARSSAVATDDGAALLEQSAALWRYVVSARSPGVDLQQAVLLFAEKNRMLDRNWWAYEGVWTYQTATQFPKITQPTLFVQPHDALLEQSRAASTLVPGSAFQELPELNRDIFDLGVAILAESLRAYLTPHAAAALMETTR